MKRVEVVAAVLQRDDGRFLLAQRPAGKVYAGYWEFPGGKLEAGESAEQALERELHEELGIDVIQAYPWITRDYDYEHAAVRLRFYRVSRWSGTLHGRENQQFAWQDTVAQTVSPLLPANGPILRALALPTWYGVSNAAEMGLACFEARLELALERGLRLIQLREKSLSPDTLGEFIAKVLPLAHRYGARVLLNGDPREAIRTSCDGVHLSAARLMSLSRRPDLPLVGASCHDERELTHAAHIGADFAVVGPIAGTLSHPGATPLGWDRLRKLLADYPLPVFAIGGLTLDDMSAAWRAGAHGVAAIRAAWPGDRPPS